MECAHCDADIHQRRTVVLSLDDSTTLHFCSESCERRWMKSEIVRLRNNANAEVDRLRRFLTRIYITSRAKARAIAKTALHTNQPP